jgi:hypothetical protein
MLPYLSEHKMRISFLIHHLKNGEGGHLIIMHKVMHVLCRYFLVNWRLQGKVVLYLGKPHIKLVMNNPVTSIRE